MKPTNFSQISARYERTSLVQKSASDELFDLLDIGESEDVMDLGCGTGYLTQRIRQITKGRVVGIDSAEGMIREAIRKYAHTSIEFEVADAHKLDYSEEFDVIFCNSTFQWFNPPEPALKSCHRALRKNGRIRIQAPAKNVYSPNFIQAIENVRLDASTNTTFDHFVAPWFFRETPEEYAHVSTNAGFTVVSSRIDKVVTSYTVEEVFNIFDSGAAAGYLNQECYTTPVNQEYIENFRHMVKRSFDEQITENGNVDLVFFRICLLATKM